MFTEPLESQSPDVASPDATVTRAGESPASRWNALVCSWWRPAKPANIRLRRGMIVSFLAFGGLALAARLV